MYTKLLGRAPDAEGLAYWTKQFGETATPAQQAQFMATAQNILTKDPTLQASLAPNLMSIEDMYSKGLGRAADAPGLAYWKQQFGNYATPEQQAQFLATAKAQSAGSTPAVQQQLAPNLYTTPAPTTTVAPTTAAPVVNSAKDLYTQILGREPDAAGLAYWQSQFGTGSVTPAQQAQFLATAKDYLATLPPDQQAALAPNLVQKANQGGIMNLARGGSTGTYLQGSTDGMADELHTTIDNKQPAALSHGEFVIPADVVSHLGNGNSDAGAKKLYSMMDKIRQARTGTKKQGKQINPDKFMPGGLAQAYAAGGEVKHFATGDTVPAGTTGVDQTLASWTGDYVPQMLGQAQALANAPYQQYQGPLTAGAAPLQSAAFTTASNLSTPASIGTAATTAGNIATNAQGLAYQPTTTTFGTDQAKQYMNPYLQQSLDPQLAEARRQSDITEQQNNAAMTKAGAFGGGRQAILTSENQRNLGTSLAGITGQGYNTAYNNAQQQFNTEQARKSQEGQFGATYGLQGLQTGLQAAQTQGNLGATQNATNLANLGEQASLGATQRGITGEGIAADQAAFNAARQNPYTNLQFQQSMLNGLPITATNYTAVQPSALTSASAGATTVNTLLKTLGLA